MYAIVVVLLQLNQIINTTQYYRGCTELSKTLRYILSVRIIFFLTWFPLAAMQRQPCCVSASHSISNCFYYILPSNFTERSSFMLTFIPANVVEKRDTNEHFHWGEIGSITSTTSLDIRNPGWGAPHGPCLSCP